MRALRLIAGIIAAIILAFAAIAGRDHVRSLRVNRGIAQAVARGVGTTVSIPDLATFSWDRLYVISPYMTTSYISSMLGFEWSGAKKIEQSSDGHCWLVFVKKHTVTARIEHPENEGGCGPLYNHGFSRQDAVFVVTEGPSRGWLELDVVR